MYFHMSAMGKKHVEFLKIALFFFHEVSMNLPFIFLRLHFNLDALGNSTAGNRMIRLFELRFHTETKS